MAATYLNRRNGRYHFRMRVPQDLLSVVNSREIHRSLNTTDLRVASHAQETNASGNERLWPELRRSKLGNLSGGYSKWFGDYRRIIGLTDPKTTFHSFRHTFIDRLKQLDVSDGKIQELVGHANHSITTGRYGKPYRPPALQEIIEALDYGLDLRKLHVDQGLAE